MLPSTEPESESASQDLDRSFGASVKRITRTLLIGTAVAASLLAFPSVLPWMLGGWILWHTVLMLRGQPAYLPLATCLVLMIVKFVPRTPSILLFGLLLLTVAWMRRSGARCETLNRPKLRAMTIVLWIVWGLVYVQWQRHATHGGPLTLDPQRPIVCIGDSLTQGMLPDRVSGAAAENGSGSGDQFRVLRNCDGTRARSASTCAGRSSPGGRDRIGRT